MIVRRKRSKHNSIHKKIRNAKEKIKDFFMNSLRVKDLKFYVMKKWCLKFKKPKNESI